MKLAILGIDGVGKSTVIDQVLKKYHGQKIKHFHFMPIDYIERGNNSDDFSKIKTYNLFLSQIKLIYIILKFNIFWLLNITFLKYDIILFDRVIFDAALDPERYLLNKKTKGLSLLFLMIKYMDKVIILHCDKTELIKRSQENSLERIEKVQGLYINAAHKYNLKLVNTNNDIIKITKEIYEELEDI